MSLILALIVLLGYFALFGTATVFEETASDSVVARQVPAVVDGAYQLPAGDALVIHARASNGPVSPAYQFGYEITIDAGGRAVAVEFPPGWAASPPTASERTTTTDLGETGLQALVAELDAAEFFLIAPADETNEPPVGGDTSNITVTLADGTWDVQGGVTGSDRGRLIAAQRLIADAVGFVPSDQLSGG